MFNPVEREGRRGGGDGATVEGTVLSYILNRVSLSLTWGDNKQGVK